MPSSGHNKITGSNARWPHQLPMRARWAARVAQFWRYSITLPLVVEDLDQVEQGKVHRDDHGADNA